ncbi:MAG: SPFH domain-containing protein [Bradymonadia bacterium]
MSDDTAPKTTPETVPTPPPLLDRRTWTPERTQLFARGLYHVAACDGVDPREEEVIRQFLRQVGLPDDLTPLANATFDYAEAARGLNSMWLRRMFLSACRAVVLADGKITEAERDCMRSIAAALGLGEQLITQEALPRIPEHGEADPDLARWIAEQPVDHVSWDDEAQPGYFWVFPHSDHLLAYDARIEVSRGQGVLVLHEGEITDVLEAGDYHATPAHLPGLSARVQWQGGPIRPDFIFLSMMSSSLMRWGTTDPIQVSDADHGVVPLRAFGRFSLRIKDPLAAWRRFGRQGPLPAEEFERRIRRIVAGRFGEAFKQVLKDHGDLIELLSDPQHVVASTKPLMDARLADAGLTLSRLYLENITAPASVQQRVAIQPMTHATHGQLAALTGSSLGTTTSKRTTGQALYPCPQCSHPVPMSARFCSNCGHNLKRPCVRCGASISLKAKFCSECGSPQPEEVVRGDDETLPD